MKFSSGLGRPEQQASGEIFGCCWGEPDDGFHGTVHDAHVTGVFFEGDTDRAGSGGVGAGFVEQGGSPCDGWGEKFASLDLSTSYQDLSPSEGGALHLGAAPLAVCARRPGGHIDVVVLLAKKVPHTALPCEQRSPRAWGLASSIAAACVGDCVAFFAAANLDGRGKEQKITGCQ